MENDKLVSPQELIGLSEKEKDAFIVLDISEINRIHTPKLLEYFKSTNITEIYRQLFSCLNPNLSTYAQNFLSIPNYTLLGVSPIEGKEDKAKILEIISGIGFDIYMNVKNSGLFLGEYNDNDFPFFLDHITSNAAFLLLDKTIVKKQKDKLYRI